MVFITYFSLASMQGTGISKIDIPNLDKAVHFTFYLVAVVLALFFIREISNGHFPLGKALWFAVVGAIFFGIIIEVIQYAFTLDREGDLFDALANSLGAVVGSLLMKSSFSGERLLKWKN